MNSIVIRACTCALSALLLIAPVVRADHRDPSWDRLDRIAHDLEHRGRDVLHELQSDRWRERDRSLEKKLEGFVKHAEKLHSLLERGKADHSDIEDQLSDVMHHAIEVQRELRSQRRSPISREWDEVVDVLLKFEAEFVRAENVGYNDREGRGFTALLDGVERHTARTYEIARDMGARHRDLGSLRRFRDEVSAFSRQLRRARFSKKGLSGALFRLEEFADEADRSIRRMPYSSALERSWTTALRSLRELQREAE